MIKKSTPLTLVEVIEIVKQGKKSEQVVEFIKRFSPKPIKKMNEMKEEIEQLNLIKLKDSYIIKIIDFMPTSAAEIIKVVPEASLDQNEISKILEVVKKYL